LVVQLSQLDMEMTDVVVGVNLADQIGVTKWEPPTRGASGVVGSGNSRSIHDWPNFFKYTDLEHLRLYPQSLEGKLVVATEKIHGSNSRVGRIFKLQRESPAPHTRELPQPLWRKLLRLPVRYEVLEDLRGVTYRNDTFWFPLSISPVRQMLEELSNIYGDVILYGEIYGKGVQTMEYGETELAYRAFDLSINGMYAPYAMFKAYCNWYGVDTAPEIYVGLYDFEALKQLAEGDTVVGNGVHIREGLVVRPYAEEATDPRVGRQIFKLVSDAYLLGKKSDYTEV
jgi:RNA ligase (TIGR02306 family)